MKQKSEVEVSNIIYNVCECHRVIFSLHQSSYVRIGPKANINSDVPVGTNSGLKRNGTSAIANISNQLASVRLQAIQAEKMSRELHVRSIDMFSPDIEQRLEVYYKKLCLLF